MHLRKEIGRGSKWRTRVVLLAFLAITLADVALRRDVPLASRGYILAAALAFAFLFVLWKRRREKIPKPLVKVEVTESGLTMIVEKGNASSSWSAFSSCLESPNLFVLVDRAKTTLTVLPKRAFPSESWQNWFRNLVNDLPKAAEIAVVSRPLVPASPDSITLKFRLGFRDYVDRAVASWRTWSIVLCVAGLILGISIWTDAHPPPHAVLTGKQVYFRFMLPFTLGLALMIVLVASVQPWLAHRKLLIPQELVMSEESICLASADGTGVLPWNTYTNYKETWWSFIIWRARGSHWILLPKRSFASGLDLQRCRDLIAHHLRESRWFFG